MSQYARVEYYDPEDLSLLRLRKQRPAAPASSRWGSDPLPSVASVDRAPQPDDDRDTWTYDDVEPRMDSASPPAVEGGVASPLPGVSSPRSASPDDLTSLDLIEFASWCALVYLPARFNVWLARRRASTSPKGGSP